MNYTQRVEAFSELGYRLSQTGTPEEVMNLAYIKNNWFTHDMQKRAVNTWASLLSKENLNQWLKPYALAEPTPVKTIAIIMAGNIPLVGFHDLLCVLITGNKALVKPSSDDMELMKWMIAEIIRINPAFESFIQLAEDRKLDNFHGVIATGSNNSNRYFEYYFKNYPNLLRKNRNSLAVLTGNETEEDLIALADDVFLYFGLGCRNVSKLLLPHGYNLEPLFLAFEKYKDIINHNKYANNYTYHKAIFLMNLTPHLDNGFVILKQDDGLASPLGVILFSFYENKEEVAAYLEQHKEAIQCAVGQQAGFLPFGSSQQPGLADYADGVDTIKFIQSLT